MTKPSLTPPIFDAMVARSDRLSGAAAIAREMGVSEDTVHRWARDPAVPIYKPAGRYIASRAELEAWQRTKPAA